MTTTKSQNHTVCPMCSVRTNWQLWVTPYKYQKVKKTGFIFQCLHCVQQPTYTLHNGSLLTTLWVGPGIPTAGQKTAAQNSVQWSHRFKWPSNDFRYMSCHNTTLLAWHHCIAVSWLIINIKVTFLKPVMAEALGRWQQEDQKFKGVLGYVGSYRPGLENLSSNQTKTNYQMLV